MENHCVCCGEIIPEDRQTCPACEGVVPPQEKPLSLIVKEIEERISDEENREVKRFEGLVASLQICAKDLNNANPYAFNCPRFLSETMTKAVNAINELLEENARLKDENAVGRRYAIKTKKCPACGDRPDGCPLEYPNDH